MDLYWHTLYWKKFKDVTNCPILHYSYLYYPSISATKICNKTCLHNNVFDLWLWAWRGIWNHFDLSNFDVILQTYMYMYIRALGLWLVVKTLKTTIFLEMHTCSADASCRISSHSTKIGKSEWVIFDSYHVSNFSVIHEYHGESRLHFNTMMSTLY